MNKKTIICIGAVLLTLTGCNKDLGQMEAGSITIEASIGQMTKVSYNGNASSFTDGDTILLYAWTGSGSEVPATRIVDSVPNRFDGSTWIPSRDMRWKNTDESHYFLSVYPVYANMTSFTAAPYTLDTDNYTASDLLIATNLGGTKSTGAPVKLNFDHVMAKLNVNLKFRSQWNGTPAVSSVTVTAKSAALVNYLTKSITATGSASAVNIPAVSAVPDGYALSYSGLQVPQDSINRIAVTIEGKEYVYTSDTHIPLASGKFTTLNLTVGKDSISLSSFAVTDWIADATLNADIL